MTLTLTDLLIQSAKEQAPYFKNYLRYAQKIKAEASKNLGKTRIFIFGSVLKKNEPARDIDILIISKALKNPLQKTKVRAKILKKIGVFSPFELHFATPNEYSNWYRYFLKEKVEI